MAHGRGKGGKYLPWIVDEWGSVSQKGERDDRGHEITYYEFKEEHKRQAKEAKRLREYLDTREEQTSAAQILQPQSQREAAKVAEDLRGVQGAQVGGGGTTSGGGPTATRQQWQRREAEKRRRAGRKPIQSGGVAKRILRPRRARDIIEPLGLTGGQSAGNSAVLG